MNEAEQRPPSTPPPASASAPAPAPAEPRRLYREPDDKRLAGVCAGVADYFGIDPTIVRLAVIVLTVMTGVVALAYLVAAFVVPERPPTVPRSTAPTGAEASWSTPTRVLLVIVILSVLAFADFRWWFNVPMVAVGLVLLGVWLLFAERDRPGDGLWGPGPTESGKTPPTSNAWSADSATVVADTTSEGGGASGIGDHAAGTPLPDAVGDHADVDDPVPPFADVASHDSALRAGPQGEVPPPVPPWEVGSPTSSGNLPGPPVHPATATPTGVPDRPRGAGLPLGVIAALFIGAGVVSLLAIVGAGDIGPVDAVAAGLVLVGAAMVLGTWRGNARPLIALGLPAVAVLLLADVVDVPLDAGAGDRTRVLDTAGDLRERYELTAGTLTLDLGDLPPSLRDSRDLPELEAEVGFGQLVVIVPDEMTVDVDARLGVGDIVGDPSDNEGVDVHEQFTLRGDEGGGRIDLDLEVGFGEIEVRHA